MRHCALVVALVTLISCNRNQSEWKTGSTNGNSISWTGSWPNGREKIVVLSQEWKTYVEDGAGNWAFRVKLAYPRNKADDSSMAHAKERGEVWGDDPYIIPISSLSYKLFDEDDFIIDSASVGGQHVVYNDSITIQVKQEIDKNMIQKIKYGKVHIQAGYFLLRHRDAGKKSSPRDVIIRIKQKINPNDGSPVIDPNTGESIFEEVGEPVNKTKEYPTGRYSTTVYLNIGVRDSETGKVKNAGIPSWDETEEINPNRK